MSDYNNNYYHREPASSAQGTAAVTLSGITAGLQLLANGGLGGLGGLLGGNMNGMAAQAAGCAVNDKFSTLEAEIARLKAEKYADNNGIELYKQTRNENQTLRDNILRDWVKPLADEAAANKVKIATIEADVAKNAEITELKFKLAEQKAATAQAATNGAIFSLQGQVGELLCMTRRHIPASNVCPLPMPRYNQWSVDPLATAANEPAATPTANA